MKKFNFRHPMFPSVLAEFAFPILGYFFWDWTLFYIMMFYATDLLSITIIAAMKQKWIIFPPTRSVTTDRDRKNLRNGIFKTSLVGVVSFVLFVIGLTYAFFILYPSHLKWTTLVLDFLKEEYLILLVLPVARWLEFKMFFKMRRRYLSISQKQFLSAFTKNQLLVVFFTAAAILLAYLNLSEFIIILLGVTSKLGFDLWKLSQ